MRVVPSEASRGFYRIEAASAKLQSFIRSHINPKYKQYLDDWYVKEVILLDVVKYAISIGEDIDQSDLPEVLKEFIEEALSKTAYFKSDPWETLFLLKNTPEFVVDAVWKALARYYHPDLSTGNAELFMKFKEAYDKVKATF